MAQIKLLSSNFMWILLHFCFKLIKTQSHELNSIVRPNSKFVNVSHNMERFKRDDSLLKEKKKQNKIALYSNWNNGQRILAARFLQKKWMFGKSTSIEFIDWFIYVEIGSVFEIIDSNVQQLIIVNVMAGMTVATTIDRLILYNHWICIQHFD